MSEWVEFYVLLDTQQVISETSLYRQSLALVLTTDNSKQMGENTPKHKINKLALGKYNMQKHTENPLTKPKSLAVPSS